MEMSNTYTIINFPRDYHTFSYHNSSFRLPR
nr:MAG TPA: hypothetical protein [Crassvirales sp.]